MTGAPLVSLHVNTEARFGGGESQVQLLARGLAARGHRVVIAARARGPLIGQAADAGLPVVAIRPSFEFCPVTTARLARVLRETRADVLHLHTPHAVGFGPWAARLAGTRAVVAARRTFPSRPAGPFVRWKWNRAGRIVAISVALGEALRRQGFDSGRLRVIRSGVDLRRLAAVAPRDPRGEFGWPADSVVVACVGNLLPVKGHLRLVRAASIVARFEPKGRFFIAGEGPERGALARAVETEGLSGRFRLAGFRDDAVALLRGSDLFVLPSRAEGLGTSLLDALALGLPSITTDATGGPEIFGEGDGAAGSIVPAKGDDDGRLLAAEILRLLRDPALRERLRRAGPRRAALYSIERTVAETEALYRELLAEDGREAPSGAG